MTVSIKGFTETKRAIMNPASFAMVNGLTMGEAERLVNMTDGYSMVQLLQSAMAWTDEELEDFISGERRPVDYDLMPKSITARINLYTKIARFLSEHIEHDEAAEELLITLVLAVFDDIFAKLHHQLDIKRHMLVGKPDNLKVKADWQRKVRKYCKTIAPESESVYDNVMQLTLGGWNAMPMLVALNMQVSEKELEVLKWMEKQATSPQFAQMKLAIMQLQVEFLKSIGLTPSDVIEWEGLEGVDLESALVKALNHKPYLEETLDALSEDLDCVPTGQIMYSDLIQMVGKACNFSSRQLSMEEAVQRLEQIQAQVNELIGAEVSENSLEATLIPTRLGAVLRPFMVSYLNENGDQVTVQVVSPLTSYGKLVEALAHEGAHMWHAHKLGELWEGLGGGEKEDLANAVAKSAVKALGTGSNEKPSMFRTAYADIGDMMYATVQLHIWNWLYEGKDPAEVYDLADKLVQQTYSVKLGNLEISMMDLQSVLSNSNRLPSDGFLYITRQLLAMSGVEVDEDDDDTPESEVETIHQVMVSIGGGAWLTNTDMWSLLAVGASQTKHPIAKVVRKTHDELS